MKLRFRTLCAAALVATLVGGCCRPGGSACGGQKPSTPSQDVPTTTLKLELAGSGLGRPTIYTFAQLADMEMVDIDRVLMQRSYEPDEWTGWRGPLLAALLAQAQIKPGRMIVDLEAIDGYKIRCMHEDLGSAIIALQDGEGRWLADLDRTAPTRLVPPELPGNYWVRNLTRITVEPAPQTDHTSGDTMPGQ